MDLFLCFIFVIMFCEMKTCTARKTHRLEAEEILHGDLTTAYIKDRIDASNGKVMSLSEGDTVYLYICTSSQTYLQILDVRFANSREPVEFSISLQNQVIFYYKTDIGQSYERSAGHFMSISKPMYEKRMRTGRFRLELKVQHTGRRGIELDYIELVLGNNQSTEEITCKVHCMSDIPYRGSIQGVRLPVDIFKTPYILQKSFTTICAEEDNINIPMIMENFRSVRITATFPKYHSFVNERTADFKHCAMVSALWTFEEIIFESDERPGKRFHRASVGPKHTKHVNGDVAALITGINARQMTVNIRFKMEGQAIGVVDADIGSRLIIKLRGMADNTEVQMKYRGRYDRWFTGETKSFSKFETEHLWHIPDFTWSEHRYNYIHVEIHYPWGTLQKYADIEKIELSRRYKRPTSTFHMYNDGKYLMEGADIDFWWLINQTMSFRILDTGELFPAVDYFRIYSKIPWSKDLFSQIFVMYQDGYVRLLPVSPHGIDWIPFGSSILIGQSEIDAVRPSAPIKHIDISMEDLILHIYYKNGGYISLKIIPKFLSTVVHLQTASLATNSNKTALLTFRSMWVANGNADVDHVGVDGTVHHIFSDGWAQLEGFYFAFFRKCISKHNSLSPDILVEVDDIR